MKLKILICALLFSFASFVDAEEIKTYSGSFHDFSGVYMLYPKATYQYYEAEDLTRIYHGPFSMTFTGDGSTNQRKRVGSLKGNFKNGKFDGQWTLVYPTMEYKYTGRKNLKILYTITVKINFVDGEIDGPVEVVVSNSANKVLTKTVMNYSNGIREGEFSYSWPQTNRAIPEIEEVKGQYHNGAPVGKWTYQYGLNKGIADYDNDLNYMIDYRTGAKKDGISLDLYKLSYPGISFAKLMNVFGAITPSTSESFPEIWY